MGNQLFVSPLPINISDALKYGIVGLGAIMAVLTYLLIKTEQRKPAPRTPILITIFIFMLFSLVLVVLGMLSKPEVEKFISDYRGYVVPHQEKEKVKKLPDESSGKYTLMKDISIFDLRGWKAVPTDKKNEEYSPANYINYLHIKKTQPLDSIVIHYATSGYEIDLRCITQNYKLYQVDTTTADHKGQKSYGIVIDVSKVPLNEEFLVVIEATYWNGFGNPITESALTYTDEEITGLNELDLIILLPYDKPIKQVDRLSGKEGVFTPYRDNEKFYVDQNKRFVYWSIKTISPNTHYKLDWTW